MCLSYGTGPILDDDFFFNDIITSIAVVSLWWDFANFGVILEFLTKKFDFSLIFIISLIFKHNVLKYDKKFTQRIKF